MTLIDSNVLIDIFSSDPHWSSWSESALADAADTGEVAINPIIYAEISVGFEKHEVLDAALAESGVRRLELPYEAGFVAGKGFLEYRRRGGARSSPLPDFYIGAHAAIMGLTLLTRDPSRYASYFPGVRMIVPV